MRVVCDNCGATYKIPEHKLSREVNKATCRKCGHTIIIRRPGVGGPTVASQPPAVRADGDSTQISSEADLRARAMAGSAPVQEEYVPPTVVKSPAPAHGDQTMPRADVRPPTPQRQAPPPPRVAPRPPSQAPSMAPAAPAPVVGVPMPTPKAHDPSGDLILVMAGCFAAIVGAGLMAANLGVEASAIGLAVAFVSSITSLMVLITSDRGRKPAKPVLSMFLGIFLAGLAVGGALFTGLLKPPETGPAIAAADPQPETPEFPAVEPAVEPETDPEADPQKEPAAEPEKAPRPDPEPAVASVSPDPRPTPEPKVEPRTEPKTTPRVEPRVSPKVEPQSTAKTEPKNVGVQVTVLDTMLKSNKGVKTCFGKYRQETGSLPSGRITVRITVQPSGKATSAKIAGGAYANSSLDTCLSGAIKSIQFPPWEGSEPATYNYPFIL